MSSLNASSGKAKRVLVVDDEPHLTYILTFKLQQMGFEVVSASDAEEALDLIGETVPELIITDYQMPGMDGLELCRKLKETPATASVPVLMLTSRGHRVPPADLANTNIQQLLPKPFSVRELLVQVQAIMDARMVHSGAAAGPEIPPSAAP